METFSVLLAMCAGNSSVSGEFSAQRPVTRSFNVFFDLRLNKRLSKQWWGWWYETSSCPLWSHGNDLIFWGKCLGGIYLSSFVNDWMVGSHFIVGPSKIFLILSTDVIFYQGHRKVIQYISPRYTSCLSKYVRSKCHCDGGGRGGNNLKTWVAPKWND